MPYVSRENGKIVALANRPQFDGQEFVPDDNADLQAYLNPPPNPLEQLKALITQGQQAMTTNPLPLDIQGQIFDLEVFVQNYFQRGALALIEQTITNFSIPDNRVDVTTDQRNLVNTLKTQMLEVFNG